MGVRGGVFKKRRSYTGSSVRIRAAWTAAPRALSGRRAQNAAGFGFRLGPQARDGVPYVSAFGCALLGEI